MKKYNIKKIIDNNDLNVRSNLISFLTDNPDSLPLEILSRLAELTNNSRLETAAYYTDQIILDNLEKELPHIDKKTIHILEPSAGVGNFLQVIIDKYSYADQLIIDMNDIDENSIEVNQILNRYRNIPNNVTINYTNYDFISTKFDKQFDLIIGNPPFLKCNKDNLRKYSTSLVGLNTKNMAGLFLQKAITLSKYVTMIMPKYFLSNLDFKETRDKVENYSIEKIIDFGEIGFKGVLIETIAIFLDTVKNINDTYVYSVPLDITNVLDQNRLTSKQYPMWIIYRNQFFDDISENMIFDVFKVFRDRQLTNSVLNSTGSIRVLKSRNISRDGQEIIDLNGYDSFISEEDLTKFSVSKYLHNTDVFLAPNMTYYPRVMKKPANVLVNGSVAILELKSNYNIMPNQIEFLCSETFEKFYRIARNYSTRSLNIDSNSVYFFGLYNEKEEK